MSADSESRLAGATVSDAEPIDVLVRSDVPRADCNGSASTRLRRRGRAVCSWLRSSPCPKNPHSGFEEYAAQPPSTTPHPDIEKRQLRIQSVVVVDLLVSSDRTSKRFAE